MRGGGDRGAQCARALARVGRRADRIRNLPLRRFLARADRNQSHGHRCRAARGARQRPRPPSALAGNYRRDRGRWTLFSLLPATTPVTVPLAPPTLADLLLR